MRIDEIESRLSEIAAMDRTEMTKEEAVALTEEARNLKAERKEIEEKAAAEAELREAVAPEVIAEIEEKRARKENKTMPEMNKDALYRSAYLKDLARVNGVPLFGEMTEEERGAFIHTTANTGNVVPAVMLDRIIDLVESMSPMYDDATKLNMTQGFGIPRRSAIAQGDATGVSEGTANDDEQNTMGLLSLDGIEIKKHVVLSRKMKFKSIDAFESWVIDEIGKRIAVAKDAVITARLDGSAPSGGSAISGSGIASANILTSQTYGDAAIRGMFALIRGAGQRVMYANSKTIWNYLAGIENTSGQKLFIPSAMDDPVVAGRIYGAQIKVDDNLSDNVVYLGVKGSVLANDYDELSIFSAVEPKTANEIVTGYSLFDAGLENPVNFVKATFSVSP